LLHRHDHVHVDDPVEMPPDALQPLLGVGAHGRRDLHVVTGQVQLHDDLLVHFITRSSRLTPQARLRSLEGAMPMDSRYLATVRRATGMPSFERISAMRLSDSGALGGSSRIS